MPPLAAAPIASFPASRRTPREVAVPRRCGRASREVAARAMVLRATAKVHGSAGSGAVRADRVGGDLGSAGGGPVRHDGEVTNATGSSVPRPPTGEQVRIRHGGHEAVTVAVAAGLRTCSLGGSPVLDGFAEDERPGGGRGQTLAP